MPVFGEKREACERERKRVSRPRRAEAEHRRNDKGRARTTANRVPGPQRARHLPPLLLATGDDPRPPLGDQAQPQHNAPNLSDSHAYTAHSRPDASGVLQEGEGKEAECTEEGGAC